MGGKGCVD
uniref:Uncharacterized protein n=1 Tax=Oryza sativa subsp. japonica TaxID=39947 RepID=Q109I9_ORYSJ|nr:hypothetical protein LOC_Os10g33952 [Oryza sativa Japonica Group]